MSPRDLPGRGFLKYRVIHAYENKTSMEFVNVGVVAEDTDRFTYRLLDGEDLKRVRCNLYNRDALEATIEYIRQSLSEVSSLQELDQVTFYFDNFSFSSTMLSKVGYDMNEEIESLYRQYVSYKINNHQSERSTVKKIIEESIRISEEFGKDLKARIDDDRYFDMWISTRKSRFRAVVGSLNNSSDLNRAVNGAVESRLTNKIFGDVNDHLNDLGKVRKEIVERINYKVLDFHNEDAIKRSYEALLR